VAGDEAPVLAYVALADTIRTGILDGTYGAGARLPTEPELSARFAVSRSTVREALRLLSSERLIRTTRGVTGGSFVAPPDPETLSPVLEMGFSRLATAGAGSVRDLLEVRALLEVPAAGLAAGRRTRRDLTAMEAAMLDPAEPDLSVLFAANREFHVLLLRAARNPLLEALTRPVFSVLRERFLRERASPRFWIRVDRDHRAVLDRVRAGDAEGAEEAQRAHLRHLRGAYARMDRRRDAGPDHPATD
jgi:DNA-binding FadR family transcriptional regulator